MGSPPWGLTPTGFNPEDLQSILSDLSTAEQNAFGAGIDTSTTSILGKLNAILGSREFSLWQVAQAVYNAFDPLAAQSTALDNIVAITGIARNKALASSCTIYLGGSQGTTVPAGSIIAVQGTNAAFSILSAIALDPLGIGVQAISSATFGSGVVTITTTVNHGRSSGDVVFIKGATPSQYNGVYPITVTGLNTFTYVPFSIPGSSPAIGSLTWNIGIQATANSLVLDAIVASPQTLTQIITPINGWTDVGNNIAAVPGNQQETDAALRIRRINSLTGIGAARNIAIQSSLLTVPNVTNASVLENDTDVLGIPQDSLLPPHSIECLVIGGNSADIAAMIWAKKAAGINTFGNQGPFAVIDSQGFSHNIFYSIPSSVPVFCVANIQQDHNFFPVGGGTTIRNLILNAINALQPGQNLLVQPYLASLLTGIPGILESAIYIGTSAPSIKANTITTIIVTGTSGAVTTGANHNCNTGDWVFIYGTGINALNGFFQITVTGVNTYTIIVPPGTSNTATGNMNSANPVAYGSIIPNALQILTAIFANIIVNVS